VGVAVIVAWYGVLLMSYALAPAWRTTVRNRAVEALQAEFASNVRFQSFEVFLWPRVHIIARGVIIGSSGARPLIQAATADAQCHIIPWHIQTLRLEGLAVNIPTTPLAPFSSSAPARTVSVDEILAEHAQVDIFPSIGQQTPLHFDFTQLRVNNFSPGHAADFSARVSGLEAHADVQASGSFGPWNSQNPSLTPFRGTYTTQNWDLATVPGLKGILSAQGRFEGTLQQIEIAGNADVPQFGLSLSGHLMPLHVSFQAGVDASDGTGSIRNLNGMLGSSAFTGSGLALKVQDNSTRDVAVDLTVSNGRLEDILPLGVKSATSPISGVLRAQANLEIQPGKQDILDRLSLNDDFSATKARFSSLDLRERLRDVSRKAQGHPDEKASGSSISSMQGHVRLNHGIAEFSDLTFDVEGASAHLNGSYQLAGEHLDLHGQVWMEATLAQTATGIKAFFLKAAEPFFRSKHGGSVVPIKITGTRADPQFGLDLAK